MEIAGKQFDIELTKAQEVVIGLMARIGVPCGQNRIFQISKGKLEGRTQLANTLEQLITRGIVKRQHNKQYKLNGARRTPTKRKASAPKTPTKTPAKPATTKAKPKTNTIQDIPTMQAVPSPAKAEEKHTLELPETALKDLEQILHRPSRIDNLTVKLDTLRGLATLLDPTIAVVLDNVATDLKRISE